MTSLIQNHKENAQDFQCPNHQQVLLAFSFDNKRFYCKECLSEEGYYPKNSIQCDKVTEELAQAKGMIQKVAALKNSATELQKLDDPLNSKRTFEDAFSLIFDDQIDQLDRLKKRVNTVCTVYNQIEDLYDWPRITQEISDCSKYYQEQMEKYEATGSLEAAAGILSINTSENQEKLKDYERLVESKEDLRVIAHFMDLFKAELDHSLDSLRKSDELVSQCLEEINFEAKYASQRDILEEAFKNDKVKLEWSLTEPARLYRLVVTASQEELSDMLENLIKVQFLKRFVLQPVIFGNFLPIGTISVMNLLDLFNVLNQIQGLQSIEIAHKVDLQGAEEACLRKFCEVLKKFEELMELHLDFGYRSAESLEVFIEEGLAGIKSLEVLDLNLFEVGLRESIGKAMMKSFSVLENLTVLQIRLDLQGKEEGDYVSLVAQAVSGIKNLKTLDLGFGETEGNEEMLIGFFENLKCENLETLVLFLPNKVEISVGLLEEFIKCGKEMERLQNMMFSFIESEGIFSSILELISMLPSLEGYEGLFCRFKVRYCKTRREDVLELFDEEMMKDWKIMETMENNRLFGEVENIVIEKGKT